MPIVQPTTAQVTTTKAILNAPSGEGGILEAWKGKKGGTALSLCGVFLTIGFMNQADVQTWYLCLHCIKWIICSFIVAQGIHDAAKMLAIGMRPITPSEVSGTEK